jgi:hypothetical protein
MKIARLDRELVLATVTRPDLSKSDLQNWQTQGYTQVGFVANPICCEKVCQALEEGVGGQHPIYEIVTLLALDNPLFRTSHPNCRCRFAPVTKEVQPAVEEVQNETSF